MKRNTVLAAVIACGLLVAMPALAQQSPGVSNLAHDDDLKVALSAYDKGDEAPLLKIVQPRANKGEPEARSILGMIYLDGKAVPKDDAKAANLFGQAAIAGVPSADEELGYLYFRGRAGGMHNPVVGYALVQVALDHTPDQPQRKIMHTQLSWERRSMTFEQVIEARVLADEIQKLGVLPALRDYLGDSSANKVLCQVPSGPNICDKNLPGSSAMLLSVDAQGLLHQDDKEPSLEELKARFMVAAQMAPQPQVILTVESNGTPAYEVVQLLLAQARAAGIALVSVVPGNSLDNFPLAGYHHMSFIFADAMAAPDGTDIPVVPYFVAPKFRSDRQSVLVWLDERGKVTAAKLDVRYPVAKPDMDAVEQAKGLTYDPCVKDDVGVPCLVEVWVPASSALQPDADARSRHELTITPASVMTQTPPNYPADAVTALHQGTAMLLVHVSANGSPMDITFSRSSGYRELDSAAKNAVMNWTFNPQMIEGVGVDSYVKVPVNFDLHKAQAK